MLSSLLPWKMLVQRAFIRLRNYSRSPRNDCISADGPRDFPSSASSTRTRASTAFSRPACASFSFCSMRSAGPSFQFRFCIKNYKIIDKPMNYSSTTPGMFASFASSDRRQTFNSAKRPDSLRKSQRKPIFEGKVYTSFRETVRRPVSSFNNKSSHIQQVVRDDFCGCEHLLEACRHVKELLGGLSEGEMREEYVRVDGVNEKRTIMELRRKYFRYLPDNYPELFHAHLYSILSCIGEDISVNQFMTLAWIQYHAKLEHLSYFLFTDLRKSLKSRNRFQEALELQLIKYEVSWMALVVECRKSRLPLQGFVGDYYESVGALVVPVSQWGVFMKLLLRSGSRIKLRLLVYLIASKRECFYQLLNRYGESIVGLREYSRQLPWEIFLADLQQSG